MAIPIPLAPAGPDPERGSAPGLAPDQGAQDLAAAATARVEELLES